MLTPYVVNSSIPVSKASIVKSKYPSVDSNNVFVGNEKHKLLKSKIIYGANASGKSKLLDAFAFMRHYVINSSKEGQKGDEIDVHPFKLNSETENQPSEFEIIFIYKDVQYRYGFEATKTKVISEWLFHTTSKEVPLFTRDDNEYYINNLLSALPIKLIQLNT